MSSIVIVYALFGSQDAAERAARDAVDSRLAACANILAPCRSFYIWEAKRAEEDEVPVLFKTSADRREALMSRIAQGHDYDIPAILSWPVEAVPGYANGSPAPHRYFDTFRQSRCFA
jgi:periplasmic divalent cation tolerance protein